MEVRPLDHEELDAAADIWNDAVDEQGEGYGKHTIDDSRLTGFVDSDRYRPSTALGATADGDLVGFCIGYPTATDPEDDPIGRLAGIAVHPTAQREGIGAALLAAFEEAVAEAGANEIRYHINRQGTRFSHVYLDTGPYRFLLDQGYRPRNHAVRLRNDLRDFELPPEIVERREQLNEEGVTFQCVSPEDRAELLAFMETHFAGGWHDAVERATADPDGTEVLVARAGDQIVGFHGPHEVDAETGRGRFGMPGVNPEYRGRGIGKTMIYLGLANLEGMGATFTEYRTGYQRVGMSASTEIYWDTGARLVEVMCKTFVKPLP